ncbi:MAG: FkbM family methyltransferase [Steroidobacteraceae bacterium]
MRSGATRSAGARGFLAGITGYLVPRLKLAYGRLAAKLMDLTFLRADASMQLVRIGTEYGGWYCCRELLGPGRAALCCGAGEDVSFDVALNARWNMQIICVDPTPRSIAHIASLLEAVRDGRSMLIEAGPLSYDLVGFQAAEFTFIPHAVWSADGYLELFAPRNPLHVSYSALNLQRTSDTIRVPASTVKSILREVGVSRLALLKLDIEGAEHEVLRSMLAANVRPDQLLVEFDQINQPLSPLFWVDLWRILGELRAVGYRLVCREHANYVFVLFSDQERAGQQRL